MSVAPPTLTAKTPIEIVARLEDFSANINFNSPGDTIVSSAVSVTGPDTTMTVIAQAINTALTGVLIRLGGGSAFNTYVVTTLATMASGQVWQRSFYQPVVTVRG